MEPPASPQHLERSAGVARALRVELGDDVMVEITTFGRLATTTAAPDIGPPHASRSARERLAWQARSARQTIVDGPPSHPRAIAVPVLVGAKVVAVIAAWFGEQARPEEPRQVLELAAVGLAGWWARQERRRAYASARALDAGRARERERRRLAEELHGSVAQELAAARISAETAELLAGEGAAATGTTEMLATVRRQVELAQGQTRRLINALGARSPHDETPTEIVAALCREYEQKLNVRREVHVALSVPHLPPAASDELSEALAFVLREALHNVYEHAHADNVAVTAALHDGKLTVEIVDDGVGIRRDGGAVDGDAHLGIDAMRERMRVVGGTLEIGGAPGGGTRVLAVFPV